MIYFTSDTHYYHTRIIEYSKRPYKSVEEMNEALITNYNAVVKPGDLVYHLGDFGFCGKEKLATILRRLGGEKYLIFGNHDKVLRKSPELVAKHFIWAKDLAKISANGQTIILSHYSFRVWQGSHHGNWNLYGHSHGSLFDDPHLLSMDVGVDPCGYFPISFDQVAAHMKKKEWKPIDHHGMKDNE